ncbi:MAG: DUF1659 domain-containing protein [Schwartzia sp.]|nr:DUF1659 domain-containing protein [Schwartzia sp. (in: firmicutes)]
MAVTKTVQSTKLILSVETGVAADGSTVYAQRSIRNVNPVLADEDAYDVAAAIGTLQSCPVGDIARQDLSILARA